MLADELGSLTYADVERRTNEAAALVPRDTGGGQATRASVKHLPRQDTPTPYLSSPG